MKSFDRHMKIKSTDIGSSAATKTKGDWFVYEFSNSIYDALSERIEDEDEDYDEIVLGSVLV